MAEITTDYWAHNYISRDPNDIRNMVHAVGGDIRLLEGSRFIVAWQNETHAWMGDQHITGAGYVNSQTHRDQMRGIIDKHTRPFLDN